jgi:hypothetical protein
MRLLGRFTQDRRPDMILTHHDPDGINTNPAFSQGAWIGGGR